VPFVQQAKAGCGPAAIAMVVEYWATQVPGLQHVAAEAEQINRYLPVKDPKGIKGAALKAWLEKHGFQAFVFTGEESDLEHHLSKGRPVVVCIAPRGPAAALHYVVIVGISPKEVWMNDPARGKLFVEDTPRFLSEWKDTGNWSLLAVPAH
jgi:predicted double-glycine peptidase